jgi:glycosyltransferase involved in cell wall biosynthesis
MHHRFVIDENYEFVPQKPTRVSTLIPLPDSPKISVVMVSYNQVKYIRSSIESVLNQDYENIELLIIDAVSTDGTIELVEEMMKTDSRIRLLSEEDKAPLDAMHKGLHMATGHLLAVQTTSDYYYPGAFSRAVEEFRQNPKLFGVGGLCPEINADGSHRPTHSDSWCTEPTMLTVENALMWRQPDMQASFFRREALLAYGGFDARFHACHSTFFLHFVLEGIQMGGEIWIIPENWGVFRRHEDADHSMVLNHWQDIYLERGMSARHATIVFADILTPTQITAYDTLQRVEVASLIAPIKAWVNSRNLQQAIDYFDARKYRFFEDTPEVRKLNTFMEKIRKMVPQASQD